jgi:hypothetical protein
MERRIKSDTHTHIHTLIHTHTKIEIRGVRQGILTGEVSLYH